MPLYVDGVDDIENRASTAYKNALNKVYFRFPIAIASQLFNDDIQPEIDTQHHCKGKVGKMAIGELRRVEENTGAND